MSRIKGFLQRFLPEQHILPAITYVVLILLVIIIQFFLPWGLVLSLSATFMLLVPFALGRDENLFAVDRRGISKGFVITFIILAIYLFCYKIYSMLAGGSLGIREFSYSFILIQFLLVALPEEVFFRGYLQNEFGNNIKAIVIVSILFAAAHLVTICVVGGAGLNTCAQNGLTFFPSLVMGYLYYKTGTIWSSVFFHFLANVVHILLVVQ